MNSLEAKNYNPDVLTCLANLSSDEVFTPPALANSLLDMLPATIWTDKNTTFLDPCSKSGVFLREITKRLINGLEKEFPDLQKCIDHILTKQIFGIAITELTALLSRRSLYCSKDATGKYAICTVFKNIEGNIRLDSVKHTWVKGKCKYCGASQEKYERDTSLETHAYQLIHTDKPEDIFNMKFDVIIGNPPYQLSDGGFGKSATPLYNKFVEQAKKLNPRFLTMIIPSRWFAGGKGLDSFRESMLKDKNIRKIVDYENANECFPGIDLAGGVCYFLWDRDNQGKCDITNIVNGNTFTSTRQLNEFSTFIRNSRAVPIIRKVKILNEKSMDSQVSSRKPFGLATNIKPMTTGNIVLRWLNGEGPYERTKISTGVDVIDLWKVITSYVGYDHAGNPGNDGKRRVFSKIDILPPGTICTETYLVVGSYKTKKQIDTAIKPMETE